MGGIPRRKLSRSREDAFYKQLLKVDPSYTRGLHGPMSAPRRAEMFERATALILKAEGVDPLPHHQFRVWCFLHEIPDGTWGGTGTVVRMQDISAFTRESKPQTPVSTKARATMAAMSTKANQ